MIFFVILSADQLLTILKCFRCRVNMFDDHSLVVRFKYQLTWVSWSFMEVICLEIDEIAGFCQFTPLWSAPMNFQHQTSTLDTKRSHGLKVLLVFRLP